MLAASSLRSAQMILPVFRHRRVLAPSLHLLLSACVAGVVGIVVFRVWYPYPYAAIAGGTSLFFLVMAVDVCLGPALTAVVAAPAKPMRELRRDLAIIVAVQVAGLMYGVYTIALARPVYLSFEVDRFRVVTAADVEPRTLEDAPAALRSLPWLGPKLIAAVKPTDADEQARSIELGLAGFDLSMVPKNWRDYASQSRDAWKAARSVSFLLKKYPRQAGAIRAMALRAGENVEELRFLPLMSRRASWSAIVAAPDARIVGYLPVEGFL